VSSQTATVATQGSSDAQDGADVIADAISDAALEVDDERTEEEAEAADEADLVEVVEAPAKTRFSWKRLVVYGLLPVLALGLALADGYLKWLDGSSRAGSTAAAQSVQAATESTIAILSYRPDNVDRDLSAAAGRLTGGFRQQYTQLVGDVVAPGAKQQRISAVATVPAVASVSATENHAVVVVFIDQTTTIGDDAPTQTTSTVRVTLDKVHGRWLISQFDPV
jgi:Mce-associated membrane protein